MLAMFRPRGEAMTAPINPQYPLKDVHSVAELMNIAVGMEHEASLRYDQLAAMMERRGETKLAGAFREMAALERRHEAALTAWAQRDGSPAPQPRQFSWRLPETFSLEDVAGAPLSPYQVLGIAVRNEEQAFAFYTYISALSDAAPAVRGRAEAMAREELSHVAQLRQMRRAAYHAERGGRGDVKRAVTSLAEFYRLAWIAERGSADLLSGAAEHLDRSGDHVGAALLRGAGDEATRQAGSLAGLAGGGAPPPQGGIAKAAHAADGKSDDNEGLAQLLGLCERDARKVVDVYLSVAEAAKDEELLLKAQELAERAMARLAIIRSLQA